jgi:hypothetical protein
MSSSSAKPPPSDPTGLGIQVLPAPTTGEPVTALSGWNALGHAYSVTIPRQLNQSFEARRGIRALIRSIR